MERTSVAGRGGETRQQVLLLRLPSVRSRCFKHLRPAAEVYADRLRPKLKAFLALGDRLAANAITRHLCSMNVRPQERVREWAKTVFPTEDLVDRYLKRPQAIFAGKSPLQVARTQKGANWVIEELTDAAFGAPILPLKAGGKAPAPPVRYDR